MKTKQINKKKTPKLYKGTITEAAVIYRTLTLM